jgi:glutamate/tyrosine decarboxylase-like PLP-dependent enzyme
VGLAAARHELLRRQGWDVNAKGLFGAPPIRVVIGAEAHGTAFKALALLGLGRERVELVPVDGQGRMLAAALPALDERTLVLAQAGNVNTGAFDPFQEICDRAGAAGAWVHVDGAFGLWAAASPRLRHLTRGVERADSWSVDAHKTLNAPYDCGIVLCRHPEATVAAMQNTGAYIVYGDQRDGMLYTPEMSRRGRGTELWATLKTLGRSGAAQLVEGLCERARQAAALLRHAGFRVLNEVVYNQVLVACADPEQTLQTLRNLQESRECWCGSSTWQGRTVIRLSVCSWATTPQDIERTVAAFIQARG